MSQKQIDYHHFTLVTIRDKPSWNLVLYAFNHKHVVGKNEATWSTYEGDSISTQPTKEKRKFWKSGDLFLNIIYF